MEIHISGLNREQELAVWDFQSREINYTCLYDIFFNAGKVTRDLLADDMMCSNRERPTTLAWSGERYCLRNDEAQ
jgi:hypothetical protein